MGIALYQRDALIQIYTLEGSAVLSDLSVKRVYFHESTLTKEKWHLRHFYHLFFQTKC
jgi:hypothetical protein